MLDWPTVLAKQRKEANRETETQMAVVEVRILLAQIGGGESANQRQLSVRFWTRDRRDYGCSSVVV